MMKDQIERAIDLVLEQDQNGFLNILKVKKINYTVRPDGTVDVEGNINLNSMNLKKFPIKFGVVTGYFDCSHNQLTSLEGCPEKVRSYFSCNFNQLTSLEGCPGKVDGGFHCSHNLLTSLEGCPKKVKGSFDCSRNQLTTLQGCPEKVEGWFDCSYNKLTTLRGCPKKVEGGYKCDHNPLKFTKEDIELAKQGNAPLGLPLSFVLMKNKEKEFRRKKM